MQLSRASASVFRVPGPQATRRCGKEAGKPCLWPRSKVRAILLAPLGICASKRQRRQRQRALRKASPKQPGDFGSSERPRPVFWSGAFEGTWKEVLAACSWWAETSASRQFEAGIAFLGIELLNQAGGLAEATAALSGKLGIPLIVCLVDGVIGCSRERGKSSWLGRIMAHLRRWIWGSLPPRPIELEKENALSLALFQHCGALPMVIGGADKDLGFEASGTSSVAWGLPFLQGRLRWLRGWGLAGAGRRDGSRNPGRQFGGIGSSCQPCLDLCLTHLFGPLSAHGALQQLQVFALCSRTRPQSGTRSAWQRARVVLLWQERLHEHPRSGQVGTVAAPLSESPSLCAAGTERGWPAGPCGTSLAVGCRALMSHVLYCDTVTGSVKLWGSGALALLLRGPRLQAHGHCH